MTRCLLSFSQVVYQLRLNGLEESLGLNIGNVVRFVTKIEAGYKSADAVPFRSVQRCYRVDFSRRMHRVRSWQVVRVGRKRVHRLRCRKVVGRWCL